MIRGGARPGIAFRFTLLLGASVLTTGVVGLLLRRFALSPGAWLGATVAVSLAIALLCAGVFLRRIGETLGALEDGLLSFAERDYSLRLAATRRDEIGNIVERFNELGARLRTERNDSYQKEMLQHVVLESAPIALVLCNEAGRVVHANSAARGIFLGGKPLEGHAFATLLDAVPAEIRQALESPEDGIFTFDRDGEPQAFHASKRYFEISMQQHTLYLLKPLTRELDRQEAEAWKKAIRLISHELNNSLAPIASLTHSARKIAAGPEPGAKLERIFDTVEERTRHLQQFLEGYARFARLPKPARQDVAWKPFLQATEALYAFRLAGELPTTPGWFDPAQMQQVLINLLKNAVESGSAAGDVVVRVEIDGDGTSSLLTVEDRGKGMDEETLRKAMLPFYSTKKTGAGLGLSLCREIVEAHGGRLALRKREAGGVSVECRLPGKPPTTA